MPYKPEQRKAIAADMSRRGKSSEEISSFFHEHGHPGKSGGLADRLKKKHKKRKRRRAMARDSGSQ